MDLNDCAINKSIFEVGIAAHRFEKTLGYARPGPLAKPPELAVPATKEAAGRATATRCAPASRNKGLSFDGTPASLTLPGRCDSSCCHKMSDSTNRCSFIQTIIFEV
ncbi:MAG: hypothetical protein ACJA1E_000724 [Paracoccaceae bacterium]